MTTRQGVSVTTTTKPGLPAQTPPVSKVDVYRILDTSPVGARAS
jgi:hypothetical protein